MCVLKVVIWWNSCQIILDLSYGDKDSVKGNTMKGYYDV